MTAGNVARLIGDGTIVVYRPRGSFEAYAARHESGTAVWTRYVAGLDVEPMPDRLTVRVPDYGPQRGYEGVRIATVEISSRCSRCGGPRGPVRAHSFVRDGARLICDRWTNACGHVEEYSAVLAEARQLAASAGPGGRNRRKPPIAGVDGGRYKAAVDLIAEYLREVPHWRALSASNVVERAGHAEAARVIRRFVQASPTGHSTSARGAALYLNDLDTRTRMAIKDEAARTKGATK
ncbi:hypothetical protein [Streptomyces carpinensis]|uniref:hypothetical protein n=1 Tax=Streptomyces carpinensis TaxID=66369 RepID=UPI00117D590E|nr:hypothetical protein [Streptomyces carpinensis]